MRRTKFFIIFTAFFSIFFFCFQPVYAYQIPSTVNQFMQMTASGSSKIASAGAKVGLGIVAGRVILGMTVVGGVLSVALTAWDAYNRLKDGAKANLNMPSVGGSTNTITDTPSSTGWGIETTVYEWKEQHTTCGANSSNTVVAFTPNSSQYIVGQKVIKTFIPSGHNCDTDGDGFGDTLKDYYRFDYMTFYSTKSSPAASYQEQPLGTSAQTEASNTQVAISALTEALNRLDSSQTKVASLLEQGFNNQLKDSSATRQILQDALDVLTNGVPVQKGTDYIVADEDKATPLPEGQGPGEGGQPPAEPPKNAPPISDGTCSDCVRTKTFSQVWQSISASASNAPLLSFLNKLVINPAAGQKVTTVSVSASGFGSHTVDLNAWGLETFVGIIRFVLVGGAFVAAYYIIFS